jgi:chromosome segregation ATPase
LVEWFCCKKEDQKNNTDPDSGKKKYETEFPNTEFPYVEDTIVPHPDKRREWIEQVLKDLEEGEQGTEEQLNRFKYLVMKRLIRSEKNMEEVNKNMEEVTKNMNEVTRNIDALRQEVRQLTSLLEQLNKKL